jgi:eukaryotic-like serine/threonine-protein kinase
VSCLEPDALLDFLAGRLGGKTTARAREHIAACEACHAIASELVLSAAASVQERGAPRDRVASYELAAGTTVAGRYILDAPLGEGSMGVVWSATRRDDGERVAIKFLKSFDNAARRRFAREVTMASSLVHRGLVRVVEVLPDVEADCPALVLELLAGQSLATRLAGGTLAVEDACGIAGEVACALAHVHGANVVHRDLKPANVFLVASETSGAATPVVKVLDLGLGTVTADGDALAASSRITRTGEAVGTPAYMAPELLAGARGDGAADVWALGATIYETLTGTHPFAGRTSAALLRAIVRSPDAPFERLRGIAPPALLVLLRGMLGEVATQRPSMAEVAERLTSLPRHGR